MTRTPRAPALGYARRGWPVLACQPRGKAPLLEHGLHDATTVDGVIVGWWTRWPQANIGLRTGIAFDALDIDGDEGLFALGIVPASKLKLLGGVVSDPVEAVEGPMVTTGKGWHVYVTPTGCGNRAGILPHVDWRGAGGYVIAPPSVHPSGARYWWGSEEEGAPAEAALRPAPGWLLELLRPPPPPVRPIRPSASKFEEVRYALAGLRDEAQAVATAPKGCRNDTLNLAAFKMRRFVDAGQLHPSDVIEALCDAAAAAGLGGREAEATIRSGWVSDCERPGPAELWPAASPTP